MVLIKERKGIYKVREFEEAFAKHCGCQLRAGCYFRFGALHRLLEGNGCWSGDEVLVPAFTFFGHL